MLPPRQPVDTRIGNAVRNEFVWFVQKSNVIFVHRRSVIMNDAEQAVIDTIRKLASPGSRASSHNVPLETARLLCSQEEGSITLA